MKLSLLDIPRNTDREDVLDMLQDTGLIDSFDPDSVTIVSPPGRATHAVLELKDDTKLETVMTSLEQVLFFNKPLRVEPVRECGCCAPTTPQGAIMYKVVVYPVANEDEQEAVLRVVPKPHTALLTRTLQELSLSYTNREGVTTVLDRVARLTRPGGRPLEVYEDTVYNRRTEHMTRGEIVVNRSNASKR